MQKSSAQKFYVFFRLKWSFLRLFIFRAGDVEKFWDKLSVRLHKTLRWYRWETGCPESVNTGELSQLVQTDQLRNDETVATAENWEHCQEPLNGADFNGQSFARESKNRKPHREYRLCWWLIWYTWLLSNTALVLSNNIPNAQNHKTTEIFL